MPDPLPSEYDRPPGLPLSWASLRALMQLLAATPASETMVEHLVEGLRRQAPFLSRELIRQELVIIFTALLDPSFPEEAPMT